MRSLCSPMAAQAPNRHPTYAHPASGNAIHALHHSPIQHLFFRSSTRCLAAAVSSSADVRTLSRSSCEPDRQRKNLAISRIRSTKKGVASPAQVPMNAGQTAKIHDHATLPRDGGPKTTASLSCTIRKNEQEICKAQGGEGKVGTKFRKEHHMVGHKNPPTCC
jgi:hypothetical protein